MHISRAILITGCSSGIGRATAERLARRGERVYATARTIESIRPLEKLGCRLLQLDVTDEGSMRDAVAAVEGAEGAVGGLVNNAGYRLEGAVEAVSLDEVRKQFETNVFGLIRMTQLVLPGMRRRGHGRLVNVGSVGGRVTFPGGAIYHASKHSVEAISDGLRFELRGFGIAVSLIEPGFIRTGWRAATAAGSAMLPSESPYRAFHDAVARRTRKAYEGRLAIGPEPVAAVIERALRARNPRPRYLVGPSAGLFVRARQCLPDRAWDAVMRMQFPTPRGHR